MNQEEETSTEIDYPIANIYAERLIDPEDEDEMDERTNYIVAVLQEEMTDLKRQWNQIINNLIKIEPTPDYKVLIQILLLIFLIIILLFNPFGKSKSNLNFSISW